MLTPGSGSKSATSIRPQSPDGYHVTSAGPGWSLFRLASDDAWHAGLMMMPHASGSRHGLAFGVIARWSVIPFIGCVRFNGVVAWAHGDRSLAGGWSPAFHDRRAED